VLIEAAAADPLSSNLHEPLASLMAAIETWKESAQRYAWWLVVQLLAPSGSAWLLCANRFPCNCALVGFTSAQLPWCVTAGRSPPPTPWHGAAGCFPSNLPHTKAPALCIITLHTPLSHSSKIANTGTRTALALLQGAVA
jgi:hypothetical protein